MNRITPYSDISELKGVGKTRTEQLNKLGINTVRDLLFHFPRYYENRGDVKALSSAPLDTSVSLVLTVASEVKSVMIKRGFTVSKFRAFDESGSVNITYFNQNYLKDVFHQGATFRFWGKATKEKRTISMTSPSYEPVLPTKELDALVPVYPLFSGINQKFLAKLMREIVSSLPDTNFTS